MNAKKIKKLRKQYKKTLDKQTQKDLKKEIFRLARIRDIQGIALIIETIAIIILTILLIKF